MRLIDANKIVYSWQIDADGQEHDGVIIIRMLSLMSGALTWIST